MAWFADAGGFPSTLCLAAASGRHGADDAVGGPNAAAPYKGPLLVSTLPLAGDAVLWAAGAGKALCPRETRVYPGDAKGYLFRATAFLAAPLDGGKV